MAQEKSQPDSIQRFTSLIYDLVDDPKGVTVTTKNSPQGETIIQVRAPKREFGRIIGLKGRTARALRTLLTAIAAARGARYALDILESD